MVDETYDFAERNIFADSKLKLMKALWLRRYVSCEFKPRPSYIDPVTFTGMTQAVLGANTFNI